MLSQSCAFICGVVDNKYRRTTKHYSALSQEMMQPSLGCGGASELLQCKHGKKKLVIRVNIMFLYYNPSALVSI